MDYHPEISGIYFIPSSRKIILSCLFMILQIQEIEIYVDQQEEQGEKKSAKEALMMWCQRNTRGYREVHIRVIIIFFFVTKMRNTVKCFTPISFYRTLRHLGGTVWLSMHSYTIKIQIA